jgi:hypothetical protein
VYSIVARLKTTLTSRFNRSVLQLAQTFADSSSRIAEDAAANDLKKEILAKIDLQST